MTNMIKRLITEEDRCKLVEYIKEYMINKGICSFKEFAQRHVGINHQTLIRIIKGGTITPQSETLKAIALAIEHSVSDFTTLRIRDLEYKDKEEKQNE